MIPTFDPMLATSEGVWPKNPVIEPKWDGVRSIITLRADGSASIRSRNGKDVTGAYPELHVRPPATDGREGVFDGEVIAVDDSGRCSFQLLQRRMNVNNPSAHVGRHLSTSSSSMSYGWTAQQPHPHHSRNGVHCSRS